ncbi:MAG: hypothetical protein ACXVZZ_10305 [Terriglobales bacterium]
MSVKATHAVVHVSFFIAAVSDRDSCGTLSGQGYDAQIVVRCHQMLARVVEFSPASDAAAEFIEVMEATALRIVKAQAGCIAAFVQVRGLVVVGLSIWESNSAAEQYNRECYPCVQEMLRPYLKCVPKVFTFDSQETETRDGRAQTVATKALEFLRYAQP